jgi:hypothetical protein
MTDKNKKARSWKLEWKDGPGGFCQWWVDGPPSSEQHEVVFLMEGHTANLTALPSRDELAEKYAAIKYEQTPGFPSEKEWVALCSNYGFRAGWDARNEQVTALEEKLAAAKEALEKCARARECKDTFEYFPTFSRVDIEAIAKQALEKIGSLAGDL